jgi:hypothetical protein
MQNDVCLCKKQNHFSSQSLMNTPIGRWLFISLPLFTTSICYAQKKHETAQLLPPPPDIVIDGNIKEWGDSLRYYNQEKQLNYSLANDHKNLYVAIRINDRSEQIRVLRSGLTLSIDTRGKKKESFSMTFPVGINNESDFAPQGTGPDGNTNLTQADRDELMRARLTKLREIRVSGFKDVEDETITTSNTYGFKVAIDYSKDGYLVYEAAIPLKFFNVTDFTKNEWAFNFKINGITRPGESKNDGNHEGMSRGGRGGFGGSGFGGGGRGGHGGRGGNIGGNEPSADHSELSKSVDFWEKYYLAK